MTHECELCKSDNMQDLLIGSDGVFFCRSCWKPVNDEDVDEFILNKFKRLEKRK